ncbi:MAG: HEAT repeat domain-containing protein [Pseudomonadales bacterium]|nr:HEAT repeat domain-containing protein [Pseudomonadales bacterium]
MSKFSELESVVVERLPGWCRREDSLVRCIAVNGLRRLHLKDVLATSTLKELLHDPDADVRIDSAYALGELEVDSCVEDLVEIITHDPVGEARIEATKALGKIGVARVVDPLVDCIRNDGYPELEVYSDEAESNPCWEVQSEAIIALGEIASHSVVDPLISFITESDYDDLQDLGFRTLLKVDSSRAHQYIHQQYYKGDKAEKRRVVRALADSRGEGTNLGALSKQLIVDLNRSLDDEDPDIRLNAARALAQFAEAPASLALCRLLLDPNHFVREKAGEFLRQAADAEAIELLHDMLKITDPELQQLIASVLGQIGNVESGLIMSEILTVPDENLQIELLKNIGLIADSQVLPELIEFLGEDINDDMRLQVIVALGQVCSQSIEEVPSDIVSATQECLYPHIFSSNQAISVAALEAYVKYCENPGEFLLGILQIQEVEEDVTLNQDEGIAADETAVEPEISTENYAEDDSESIVDDENIIIKEEQVPLDEFLGELPEDGNPKSSTLASIFSREPEEESQPVEAPLPVGSAEWIPIYAARLLAKHTDLNQQIVDVLLNISENADESLLKEIVDVVSHVKMPQILGFLEQCLAKEGGAVVLASLHALKEMALPLTDLTAVKELLSSDDPLIRRRSLELVAINDEQSLNQYLQQAFADDDRDVCLTALEFVKKENITEELRAAVLSMLMKSGGDLTVPIAQMLRRVEDSEAISLLLDKVLDEDLKEYHWIFISALTEAYKPQLGTRE